MRARNFDQSNTIMGPPSDMRDSCTAIPAFRGDHDEDGPVVITRWHPSQEEVEALESGGDLYLTVYGKGMPPVHLGTADPFK